MTGGPRIVLYCVDPPAYRLLRAWAERQGYAFVLLVTTPGPPRARSTVYREIVAEAPSGQDILISTGMRRIAPQIAALAPDLILSYTLPYRLPAEIIALPRYGAVNLHPAPLPAYRGPNPARMIYNGEPILGATLHRTAADYDTGAILSRRTAPMPAEISPASVLSVWSELVTDALTEGIPRALAGDPGIPQDSSEASYAGSFTQEEMWLDWLLPASILQRRVTALNLLASQARATVDGHAYLVETLASLPNALPRHAPGTVIAASPGSLAVQTAEGVAQMVVRALP